MRQADAILRVSLEAMQKANVPQGEPPKLTAEQVQAYALENWRVMAASAYWGYKAHGKGCLFLFVQGELPQPLDWTKIVGIYLNRPTVYQLRYGSELITRSMVNKTLRMIDDYDPDRDFVICLANPAWEQWLTLHCYNPLVTAKEAFEQQPPMTGLMVEAGILVMAEPGE